MTKDKTAGKRQKALVERNEKRGLCQPKVWVPKHRREELIALAAKWRAEFEAEGK